MAAPDAPNMHGMPNFIPTVNEDGAREYLTKEHFPVGLQEEFIRSLDSCVMRYFICDDSGSMSITDGCRLAKKGEGFALVKGTERWAELKATVQFHMGLAKAANAPCDFRFLNGLSPKRIGCYEVDPDNTHERLINNRLNDSPNGGTPLCKILRDVIQDIQKHEQLLRNNGKQVCVIICTDGEASDGNLAMAMKPLAHLPVHVIVRLCTNEDSITEYWNNVDKDLEIQLDILDDPVGEAEEAKDANPWLNYGVPLHRIREFGTKIKELDTMDESLLSTSGMKKILAMIFNDPSMMDMEPDVDWAAFKAHVQKKNNEVGKTFNPHTQRMEPWVNMSLFSSTYSKGGCCSIM
jgi:hypothetical protein